MPALAGHLQYVYLVLKAESLFRAAAMSSTLISRKLPVLATEPVATAVAISFMNPSLPTSCCQYEMSAPQSVY